MGYCRLTVLDMYLSASITLVNRLALDPFDPLLYQRFTLLHALIFYISFPVAMGPITWACTQTIQLLFRTGITVLKIAFAD